MTPLGGPTSKVNIIYMCANCKPRPQGSIHSGGWFLTTSGIVSDPTTNKLTKIVHPRWKCPFCGAAYHLCNGAHALCIDDRESPEDGGDICILPLPHRPNQWETSHPDHELGKQVEALIDWLKAVSLVDQLSKIGANTIRAAIENTNYMVINRLKASCSVKFKKDQKHRHLGRDGNNHLWG